MKAAILHGPRDLRVEEIEIPEPKREEILIRVKACSICGYDILVYRGDMPLYGDGVGGHEFSGEIAAIGEGVSNFNVGDRVAVEPYIPCGKCGQCKTGHYNRCDNFGCIGEDRKGAFAEYVVVPSENPIEIPQFLSYDEAALIQPLAVAIHTIHQARLHGGDLIAILGSGPIGLFCIQVAKAYGAGMVIATDIYDNALRLASKLGADATINSSMKDPVDGILELTDGVDVVLDTAGGEAQTPQQALSIVKKGGRIVIVGRHTKPMELDLFIPFRKELEMIGTECFGYYGQKREFVMAAEMLYKGKIDAKTMVTHRFPLAQIEEAFETALTKHKTGASKVVVLF